MTTKTFIEKAIEGGYSLNGFEIDEWIERFTHRTLLDPKAWQAVGKVEGWKHPTSMNRGVPNGEWAENQQDMIIALQNGKTIEEFLETL